MGFSADWIERQLAHIEPNAVRLTYNHAKHLVGRAKLTQQWADMLGTWSKSENTVTSIKIGGMTNGQQSKAIIQMHLQSLGLSHRSMHGYSGWVDCFQQNRLDEERSDLQI